MKFGITLGALNPRAWEEVTIAADELGFESVWMPEHLVIPVVASGSPIAGDEHPPIPPEVPVFDVFTYLAYLAGRTTNINFGTQVYNVGLRHPFVVARGATTLDIVSRGRFLFGIGASWMKEEWDAVGLDFASRGRRVDESLGLLLRLWQDEIIEHRGEFFAFDAVKFEPKPHTRPHPPLIIGGDGPAALRRAALIGQGWIPMNHSPEQLPASIARIAALREKSGIPGRCEVTVGGGVTAPDDVERFAALGVDRLLVRPWKSSREATTGMREFADRFLA